MTATWRMRIAPEAMLAAGCARRDTARRMRGFKWKTSTHPEDRQQQLLGTCSSHANERLVPGPSAHLGSAC
jgi:hypothetical protein